MSALVLHVAVMINLAVQSAEQAADDRLPTLEEVLASPRDLWGDASRCVPGGPSYDFFARLLPPLRFVNTEFHEYPIVLGTEGSPIDARFVIDGSGVNLMATTGTWNDVGRVPVSFLWDGIGELGNARWAKGWLPIVELGDGANAGGITEEAFASVAPETMSDDALVFVRFASSRVAPTMIRVERAAAGALPAQTWALSVAAGAPQQIAISTLAAAPRAAATTGGAFVDEAGVVRVVTAAEYDAERTRCADEWEGVIGRGVRIVTGERRVDDAWRALIVGTRLLAEGDTLMYSRGNLYETTFEAECGDAVRALLAYGTPGAARLIEPLLARPLQQGLELSDTSYKLQLLAWQHSLLQDAEKTRAALALVLPETDQAIALIEPASGLVPAQAYCGDIATRVHNLLANSAFWRGLRDGVLVLRHVAGDDPALLATAERFEAVAETLKKSVLAAVETSEFNEVVPPFIPVALFGAEKPYDLLTQTKEGAYWNLIAPFVYDSGIFGADSPRTKAMLDWQIERGGLCMGMVRFDQHSGLFANETGVDDLYTLRLVDELARRDDPDRLLVSFYGKLAQGMTRDTFVGCEGSGLVPFERPDRPGSLGRAMYLPPNCAANAFFLLTLRQLLVQDLDLDLDGEPDTLRLLFATPRAWLADGAHLEVKRAPTMFGELSLDVVADLAHDRVRVELDLPPRVPRLTLLRLRLPDGFAIASASVGEHSLRLSDRETLDLTGRSGRCRFDVSVTPRAR